MKKVYLILSIIINVILLPVVGCGLIDYTPDYPLSLAVVLPLIPLSFIGISIVTLLKNKSLLKSVFLKLTIFFFLFGLTFISFNEGIYAIAIFEIIALIFLIITLTLFLCKPNIQKKVSNEIKPLSPYCYKGKWAWEDAANEYLRMTGKNSIDELSDDDNRQIYRYAMMPIAYYFYWLLKKGFMSSEFYDWVGNEISEDDIKNKNVNILELLENMDCCLSSDDMLEDAGEFSRHYAEVGFATLHSQMLIFDYYDEIKNPDGYYYCVEFLWDVCERMYDRIDKAYAEWSALFDHDTDYYEDDEAITEVFSNRFGTKLEVYRTGKKIKDNITDEYIKKCLDDLDLMNEYQFTRLDRNISDVYGDSLAGKVMEQFRADGIHIFDPQVNGDMVYVVSGGADFEEEHGISFYVRNGVIFRFGYGYDFDDIYNLENIRDYEIASNDIEFESIENLSQIEELVNAGKLVRTYLVPPEIGGTADESNMIYLTPLAIKEKELLDRRLQALISVWNGNLKYTYKAFYYDDNKQFVPKSIYVSHDANPSESVFGFTVKVWC